MEVDYAADIPTTEVPTYFSKSGNARYNYESSGFNLNRLYLSPHSLSAKALGPRLQVSGVTAPWLYIAMKFATFCWHIEDLYMHSVNYLHEGAQKTWYVVPPRQRLDFEAFVRTKTRSLAKS